MAIPVIDVHGSDLEQGRQHAATTAHLRDQVASWVAAALTAYPLSDRGHRRRLDEVISAWGRLTPQTLEQIAGMAQVYRLDQEALTLAVLTTYFSSADRAAAPMGEGCSVFGIPRQRPMLVKNRDNDRRFLGMQTVLRSTGDGDYPVLALSTAGAPGVHSSGMNQAGLSVADTHVPSSDVGPGVPRFATMMHVLRRCARVGEAVEWIMSTPQMGLGTLTLIDSTGDMAVVECGYRISQVRGAQSAGYVVATNHFRGDELASTLLPPVPGQPASTTRDRHGVLTGQLVRGGDFSTAQLWQVAASHDGPGSICVHTDRGGRGSQTVSTVIFDPRRARMLLGLGLPCQAEPVAIGW